MIISDLENYPRQKCILVYRLIESPHLYLKCKLRLQNLLADLQTYFLKFLFLLLSLFLLFKLNLKIFFLLLNEKLIFFHLLF